MSDITAPAENLTTRIVSPLKALDWGFRTAILDYFGKPYNGTKRYEAIRLAKLLVDTFQQEVKVSQ